MSEIKETEKESYSIAVDNEDNPRYVTVKIPVASISEGGENRFIYFLGFIKKLEIHCSDVINQITLKNQSKIITQIPSMKPKMEVFK